MGTRSKKVTFFERAFSPPFAMNRADLSPIRLAELPDPLSSGMVLTDLRGPGDFNTVEKALALAVTSPTFRRSYVSYMDPRAQLVAENPLGVILGGSAGRVSLGVAIVAGYTASRLDCHPGISSERARQGTRPALTLAVAADVHSGVGHRTVFGEVSFLGGNILPVRLLGNRQIVEGLPPMTEVLAPAENDLHARAVLALGHILCHAYPQNLEP